MNKIYLSIEQINYLVSKNLYNKDTHDNTNHIEYLMGLLPACIVTNSVMYCLRIYKTAWDKIAVIYKNPKDYNDVLFSNVVDGNDAATFIDALYNAVVDVVTNFENEIEK